MKIDRRKSYYILLDTETCNTRTVDGKLDMSDVLVYDICWAVVDKKGNVYKTGAYLVDEIFNEEQELMASAYYATKIPEYLEQIAKGERVVERWYKIRRQLVADMELFNTNIIIAHNARFDYNALNTTSRWLSKSKYRTFIRGAEWWDTLRMARQTIAKQKMYKHFCEEHNFLTATGRLKLTAEVLYRYITFDITFEEEHKGLEDVMIEKEIFAKCMAQHKAMEKKLFSKPFSTPYKDPFEWVKPFY